MTDRLVYSALLHYSVEKPRLYQLDASIIIVVVSPGRRGGA